MESDEETDLMAIRAKNMAQINNMFGPLFTQCQEIGEEAKTEYQIKTNSQKQRPKRRHSEVYKFSGSIPTERRKSARLANVQPEFNFEYLDEAEDTKDEDFFYDLEEVIREPTRKFKIISKRNSFAPVVRMPEDITELELANISKRSGHKTYSVNGTSCHQCRQKTVDTKTICRGRQCVGVRGQFCGPCLKNRYGENAEDALMDPSWVCPPCRNLCNCSICRTRDGKRPTGILAPAVQQEGFSSVKDFLLSLAEKGILPKETNNNVKKMPDENIDEVINNENSVGVMEALIHAYLKTISDYKIRYLQSQNESDDGLLGFTGGMPVQPSLMRYMDGDVLGFQPNLSQFCQQIDNIVFLCHFFL